MNRKARRTQHAKAKRAIKKAKNATNAMQEKMLLFDALPNKCLVCSAPFNKTNREMVMTWNVVIREKQGKVNLYCPRCWQMGTKVIEEWAQQGKNVEEKE